MSSQQSAFTFIPPGATARAEHSCFCSNPEGWGPVSKDRYDLTACFEHSILLAVSLVFYGVFLARIQTLQAMNSHGLGVTGWIFMPTQFCMTGAVVISLFSAVHLSVADTFASIEVASLFVFGGTWVVATYLNMLEHIKTIRSSSEIFSFYMFSIALLALLQRTYYQTSANASTDTNQPIALHLRWVLISLVLGFIIEAWPRGKTRVQRLAYGRSMYDKANLFSRMTLFFMWPLVRRGTREILTLDTVKPELIEVIKTRRGYNWFVAIWDARVAEIMKRSKGSTGEGQQQQQPQMDNKEPNPDLLFSTILWAHRRRLAPLVLLSLVISVLKYVPAYLLGKLLDFLQTAAGGDGAGSSSSSLTVGMTLVLGMALGSIGCALLTSYSRVVQTIITTEIRASLAAMVFRKALTLSPGARQQSSTGEILNHMSKDVEEWTDGVGYILQMLSFATQIVFALVLLYHTIGIAALGTIFGLILVIPFHIVRAHHYGRLIRIRLKHMDERVRRLTEVLSGIKVVKLYGWESAYLERIRAIREHELSLLRHLGYFFGLMSIIFISAPSIFSLLTFTAFALWGGPNGTPGTFTPKIVFVSLTLFSMLRDPIGKLSDATTCTIEVVVGMRRVQRFLLREELDAGQIERHDAIATPPEGVPMIAIRQATFSWHGSKPSSTKSLDLPAAQGQDPAHESEIFPDNSDECELLLPPSAESTSQDNPPTALRPTLDNITIDFAPQKLTAIVGRVGQGKSSLLSAMLGEMYRWQGTVTMYGRVAYVPQQAWIMNATVRANILFGQEYEAKRYEAIVAACGLEPDLATLPAGDATEIGERGINLSGGQKQRVALARAAYADADVYLLDDPLSAVDAHVDRHLWERLVGPRGLLAGKTRVLVTHGIHHLRQVDRIVVLKDGRVAEQGRYEELMARRDMFYQLIKEYSVAERMERKKKKQNKGVSSHQGGEALEGDVSSSAGSLSEDGLDGCNSDTQHSPLVGAAAATGAGSEDIDTDDTASDGADKVAAAVQEEGKAQRKQDTEAELIKQELLRTGKIGLDVSMIYIKGLSFRLYGLVIVLHLVAHSCNISGTLWLKRWATTAASLVFGDDSPEAISVSRLLGVYSVFALSYVGLFVVIQIIMFAYARVRASRVIHDNLLKRVLRLPMAFFDTTPLGRVINRFSSDMFTIDDRVPWRFVDMVNFGISVMATVCIVLYSTPLVAIVLFPCLGLALYVIQWHYVRAGAVIKRLHTVAKSPLYSHFHEILGGVTTIRAMQVQHRCMDENQKLVGSLSAAWLVHSYCTRWLEVQLRLLSALLALAVSAAAVVMAVIGSRKGWSALDPGMIGLSMTFVLTWTEDVAWLVRIYGDLQTYLVGLERIQEYTDLPVEAPAQREDWESRPLPPSSLHSRGGHLVFRHYSTRYREGTDLVLRDVSFEVQPGEKIGIVGRTGAGKSSLTLALFRIVEAANSHWAKMASPYANITTDESERGRHPDELIDGGKIEVDGVDISTLGLDDLRHSLAIIPQDPTLFAGTVRDNLDPFGEHQDADLWQALERASLKATVQALPDGLGLLSAVAAQGENFSVGQRSLLCLARALLRKEAKILVLDEATSSVDLQTDEWIQRTIRAEFEDRTILTIAHRIKTVMDYNKILVLDQGRVVEFAAPNVLLQDKQSLFYRLALQAGEVQE